MTAQRIPALTQRGERAIVDLLVVRLLEGPDGYNTVRMAKRLRGGDYTLRSYPWPAGRLSVALCDEIAAMADQLVQDALLDLIGAQEPLGELRG